MSQEAINQLQSTLQQSRHLLEEARAANNKDVVTKTTFFLLEQYPIHHFYDEAIDLIHQCINEQWFDDYHLLMKIADKYVQLTLQMEDYEEMERAISYRETFLGYFPKEEIMQFFYRSVALEGRKQYPQAIEALLQVPDTLSNSNLTSKYLKLAMLYLKVDQLRLAQESVQTAKRFDPHQRNEIFLLVETDLAIRQGLFQAAKQSFERFFLKTKQKTRYLDRLIDIDLALEDYAEAKRLIDEYLPKVTSLQSKSYRLQFFEAMKRYAQKTKDKELEKQVCEEISTLSKMVSMSDTLEADLMSFLKKNTPTERLRDILLQFFQIVSKHLNVDRFDFIEIIPSGMQVYHYASMRLYERSLSYDQYLKTALQSLSEEHHPYLVLQASDIENVDYWKNGPLLEEHQKAIVRPVFLQESLFGYLLAIVKNDDQYPKQFHHFQTAVGLLALKLFTFQQRQELKQRLDIYDHAFEQHQIGFLRIANHYLFLLNQAAKDILEIKTDIFSYEEFQKLIIEPKMVYLDQIYTGSIPKLVIRSPKKQTKTLQVHRFIVGDVIYLSFIERMEQKQEVHESNKVGFSTSLVEALKTIHAPSSFILIESRFQQIDDWKLREAFHQRILEFITKAAQEQKMKVEVIHQFGFLVNLPTLDKRIVNRIAKQIDLWIHDEMAYRLPTIATKDVTLFCSTYSKERSIESFVDAIDTRLLAPRNEAIEWIDKDTYERLAFQNAQRMRLEEWIHSERLPIQYALYVNPQNRQIAFVNTTILDPFEKDTMLDTTIQRYGLEESFDQVLFKQLLKEMEIFYKTTRFKVPFLVSFHRQSIAKYMSHRLFIGEAKRRKIPLELLILCFEMESAAHPLFTQEMRLLSEKGFQIAIRVQPFVPLERLIESQFVDYFVVSEASWIAHFQRFDKPILYWKDRHESFNEGEIIPTNAILPIDNPVKFHSLTDCMQIIMKLTNIEE